MKEQQVNVNLNKIIEDPSIIKSFDYDSLNVLSNSIRENIIDACSLNGGHLSSNLGTVELTVALHHYFNFPTDKLIFDVGHQCYAHKLLSKRSLENLRCENGIDGFQKRKESIYDPYEAGHSSTSISAAMGMALTRDLNNEDYNVIAIIGDASIANGLSFEALNLLSGFHHKMLIILNDNEMSITKPVGGLHKFLSSIRVSKSYLDKKTKYREVLTKHSWTRWFYKMTSAIKNFIAKHLYNGNIFEELGINYYGIVDGHNIKKIEKALNKIKSCHEPVILHVKTKKGKGYKLAENDTLGVYHGVSPFDKSKGIIENDSNNSWNKVYADMLLDSMKENKNIISIVSATGYGSSLNEIATNYPDRFFDVGIAEEHALVFASGIASNNAKPYVSIYSTFLQRGYDEIIHDFARMDLPVTLLIDRAGLVGKDGQTHQGIYDNAFLNTIPNIVVAMASNKNEAKALFDFSLTYNHPLAIRFPKTDAIDFNDKISDLTLGEWKVYDKKSNTAIITYGPKVVELINSNVNATIVNAIFTSMINKEVLTSLLNYKNIIIYDTYGTINGFANNVLLAMYELGYKNNIKVLAIPNTYVDKGSIKEQEARYNISLDDIIKLVNQYED